GHAVEEGEEPARGARLPDPVGDGGAVGHPQALQLIVDRVSAPWTSRAPRGPAAGAHVSGMIASAALTRRSAVGSSLGHRQVDGQRSPPSRVVRSPGILSRRKSMTSIRRVAAACLAASLVWCLAEGAPPARAETTLKVVMHSDLKIVDPIWTTAYIVRNHGYM